MKRNMRDWRRSIIASPTRKAMPIMTYPGLAITGNTVREMVTRGDVQFACIQALMMRYPSIASATLIMDLSVESEAFGCAISYSDHEIPTVTGRLIDSFDAISALPLPSVGAGRSGEYLKAARRAAETITDRPALGGIIGPFSLAGRLYDITEFMTAVLIEPEGAHALLAKCNDFLITYAQAFKDAGANGVVIAEPAAGLLSPALCDEFSSRYVSRIVDAVQDDSFLVMLHNCGNTRQLVASMQSTGSMALHFGNAVDMLDILPQVAPDILALGNIDPARIIRESSPETVYAETRTLLNQTSEFRNFVISSGCDIPPGTPLANIDAFFRAVADGNG